MNDIAEPRTACAICGWVSAKENFGRCIICDRVVCLTPSEPCAVVRSGEAVCCECDGTAIKEPETCEHWHSKLRGDFCCAPNERQICPCDGVKEDCPDEPA